MGAPWTTDEPCPLSLLLFSFWVVSYCLRPCQASLSFTISWSLLKLMSIESVMPSNHLILCPPLLLLPSVFPSIRIFSSESALCIRWPKYWNFSIILPMNIQSWFPLRLTGFISLLSKGLSRVFSSIIVRRHQFFGAQLFFIVQLTSVYDYWKNHRLDYMDLCRQSKSLFFNMLSSLS